MNTSYRVCELVRAKISNEHLTASDTDISRVLGVSRTAVSAYKHEKNVMSVDTLAKAQDVLKMPQQEYFDLMLTLTAEGASDPSLQDTWVKLHRLVRGALKHSGSRVAGCLTPAIVAVGMTFAYPSNQAVAAVSNGPIYTLCEVKNQPFAPAAPGCLSKSQVYIPTLVA